MSTILSPRWTVWAITAVLAITGGVLRLAAVNAADTEVAPKDATVSNAETFTRSTGETFYAVGLTAKVEPAAVRPHDLVVMFDTSASQAGEFREKGLAALKTMLDTLADGDRVKLLAVDLAAVPLTETFVAVRSPEMQAGLAALHKRVPLGATDMAVALDAAVQSFSQSTERAAGVVYIGDGMSTAQLVSTKRMKKIVDQLVARRASVTSYAIGPRLDTMLLGVLANHTGGVIVVEQTDISGLQIGMYLANAVSSEVIWPRGEAKYAATIGDVYPKQFPPLRFDRDTVLIGRADQVPTGSVVIHAEVAGRTVALAWNISAKPSAEDNSYLTDLISLAKRDGGLSLPLAGSSTLQQASALVGMRVLALVRLAQQALATGSNDNAEKLANEALRLDASNPEALAVRSVLEKAKGDKARSKPLKLVNFQVPAENVAPAPPAPAANADLLREELLQKQVLEQLMRTEVTQTINQARASLGTDPNGAIDSLKLLLDKVGKSPELAPDTRAQLRNRIEASLMEASRRKVVKDEQDLRDQQIAAERRARISLERDLQNREEKVKQLMDRFENLMAEQRYGDAFDTAELARAEAPNLSVLTQAGTIAFDTNAIRQAQAIKVAAQEGFQSMLASLDRSAIPFSDDPPVVYPDAETWRLMTERRAKYRNVDLASKKSDNEKQIIETLNKKVSLENLDQIPLRDVIDIIKTTHKIPMIFDSKALQDAGIQEDVLVSINVRDVTLRSALRVLLRPHELTYIIKDEVLQVTSKAAADDIAQNGVTKVYPVADLVVPIPQGGLSGFGGLGGSQGGLGGMGGGGGGFGGGGGQGGGFGGGGGFAVPPENLEDGDQLAFADGLKLSGKKPVEAAKPAPAPVTVAPANVQPAPVVAGPRAEVQPVQIEISASEDVNAAWDKYFATHEEVPASAVRESVRRLMKATKYDHVIAVINAALRNDQAQPWMYEALGIALQAGGSTPQEVERAMMSAVDFRAGATDLVHVAQYLLKALPGNRTIEQRALKLYQQVAEMEPTQPQAYVDALLLAHRLSDIEAIQWATVGILSQAWPKEQREIALLAKRVAAETFDYLRDQKRLDEADAFKKACENATVRDCMIVVSWTGNADIDLLVEEPAGTVCTFRNPRSTSGGVMLGDSMATGDDRTAGTISETYVCPQGFDGNYKMLLRRVWGKTTVDKVTVDYYVHHGSANERRFRRQISLADGEAAVSFELKNGRRVEPIEEQQVVNAAAGQLAIGRAILAQQLGQLPTTGRSLVDPGGTTGGGFVPVIPYAQQAVGYQPVIITLPTGSNMSAVAVVSADRRYVRVTAQPLFSQIPQVNTFNYASGSSGTSNGGTSGGATGAGTGTTGVGT